jgi:hypothetical protein
MLLFYYLVCPRFYENTFLLKLDGTNRKNRHYPT